MASLAGNPNPSKNEGTSATRAVEYCATNSGTVSMRSTIWTRFSSPNRLISRGTSPWLGIRPSTIFKVTASGNIDKASNIVPMPFFRSSVRPTKSRSDSFSISGIGRKISVSVPL